MFDLSKERYPEEVHYVPKVIKDAQEQILQSATELFGQLGYRATDMKKISEKTGIAVGTIYNYYPNKKKLYISVLEKSWSETFHKLEQIREEIDSPKDLLEQTIRILYCDMEQRVGLGKIFFRQGYGEILSDPDITRINSTIVSKVADIIKSVRKDENADVNIRLAETLIVSLCVLLAAHPQEREENVAFLDKMATSFLMRAESAP